MGMRVTLVGAAVLTVTVALGAGALATTKSGGPGPDRLRGTKGADKLLGRSGSDRLYGRGGPDALIGGRGKDVLVGGPGRDGFNMKAGVELAAPGPDRIRARDGRADEISCGRGRDVAIVDEVEDGVYDCEKVREP